MGVSVSMDRFGGDCLQRTTMIVASVVAGATTLIAVSRLRSRTPWNREAPSRLLRDGYVSPPTDVRLPTDIKEDIRVWRVLAYILFNIP